ncbi:MAG: leucine-rich repeat domain-containing protein [Candidatus Helarchaeota archaeon]|nr:leucine-rich repeat domain-containing protein [Candidatus Helarchaeota archaeon]
MGRKYKKVTEKQAKVLEELEEAIGGKELKKRKEIVWDSWGYKVEKSGEVIELNLSFKNIEKLPESFGDLKSLQKLYLNKNELTSLPNSIGNLKSLQFIALEENKLNSLPDSIGNLGSLKELRLNRNRITELPTSIGKLKSLEDLHLERNRITALPDSLGDIKTLQSLDLSHNQLTKIPESIGKLKSLKNLDLEHNKVEWLPESVANLKKLERLDLSNNILKMLPGFFDNLKNLEILDLRRNQLVTLPGYLYRLNLQEIRITGNPLIGEWKKLKRKDTDAILEFCRQAGSVNVFMSYSVADYESANYPIDEIAKYLKEQEYISYVYHCSQDMKTHGQIDKFMNEVIPHCQFVVFLGTKRSIKSGACLHELNVTLTHKIKIIPILFDVTWESAALKRAGLTREFGLNYSDYGDNVRKLTEELYDHILQYKRTFNVFTKQEAERQVELDNIKRSVMNFLESDEFRKALKKNLDQFKESFKQLSLGKLSPKKYFLQCAELLSPPKKAVKKAAAKAPKKAAKKSAKKSAKKAAKKSAKKAAKKPAKKAAKKSTDKSTKKETKKSKGTKK